MDLTCTNIDVFLIYINEERAPEEAKTETDHSSLQWSSGFGTALLTSYPQVYIYLRLDLTDPNGNIKAFLLSTE